MERKHTQAQAQVGGQKQNRKDKGNPKVQNEPEKDIQKSKTDTEENEKQASSQSAMSSDSEFNSELQKAEPEFKKDPNVKASTLGKAEIKIKNLDENKDENKKERPLEDKPPTEQAPAIVPSGVKPKPSGSFSDEHKDRGPDKDSSDSEDGYTTPEKRKAKCNVTRPAENFNIVRFKVIPPGPRYPVLQQGFQNLRFYSSHQRGIRLESPKPMWKSERWVVGVGRGRSGPGYTQEKAFNMSPGPNSPKVDPCPTTVPTAPVVPKEEAWSLFKQPTVFSMGNSNVPKVTYTSKVKQNLNRVESPAITLGSCSQSELSPESAVTLPAASVTIGAPILMPSEGMAQVPMSALKSVNSLDFATSPEKSMKAESSQVLPLEACLIKRPSPSPKSVIQKTNPSCSPIEPSLFPFPSDTPAAPMGLIANIKPFQSDIQMLREIFESDWGLSFTTEPIISPEIAQEMAPDPKVIQLPQPYKYPSPLAPQEPSKSPCIPEHVLLPKVYDVSKWLNPQGFEDIIKPPASVKESDALVLDPSLGDEYLQQADPKSNEALTLLPSNYKMENPEPLPINPSPDSTLEDSEQKNAWEPFNASAAAEYHMAEIQSILDMQQQDPPKIVIYDDSMDSSAP